MIAAYQGRCPTCGHDSSNATEEYRKWFESRVHLEDGCEIGVGRLAAPDATSPASQVGDDHGSFSQAKIPTAPEVNAVAICMNRGGNVHPWAAGCLVPGCYAEMGEACRNPDKEARP